MPVPATTVTSASTRPVSSRGRHPVGGKDSIDFSSVVSTASSSNKPAVVRAPVGGKDSIDFSSVSSSVQMLNKGKGRTHMGGKDSIDFTSVSTTASVPNKGKGRTYAAGKDSIDFSSKEPVARPVSSRGRSTVGGKDSVDFSPVPASVPYTGKPVGGKDTLVIKHDSVRSTLLHAVHTKSINNLGDEPTVPRKSVQSKSAIKFDGWLNATSPAAKRVRKGVNSPDHSSCKSVLRHDLWTPSYIDSPRKVGKVGPSVGGVDSLVLN